MSYPRRNRWFRRTAVGFAFASVMFAGSTSVVAAMIDPGTQGYVKAGGWSGMVDLELGHPAVGGDPARRRRVHRRAVPHGDPVPLAWDANAGAGGRHRQAGLTTIRI